MPSKRKDSKVSESPESIRKTKRRASAAKSMEEVTDESFEQQIDLVELKPKRSPVKQEDKEDDNEVEAKFLGEPVPKEEAMQRWPHRYTKKSDLKAITEEVTQARCHYVKAEVDGQVYVLNDDAFVQADPGKESFICKIIEIFEAVDGSQKFSAQWYYRANDTVIQDCGAHLDIDKQCIFFSEVKDDNPLDCLLQKIRISRLSNKVENDEMGKVKSNCDFYCDKMYLLPFTSFVSLQTDSAADSNNNESGSTISSESDGDGATGSLPAESSCNEKTLLDLYSGCGAMSTGLCLGANSNGVKLVAKWAVDINKYACDSLRLNHPETQVRHEAAEDFLNLIKEWEKLCQSILSSEVNGSVKEDDSLEDMEDSEENDEGDAGEEDSEIYEVDEILDVCYGNPNNKEKPELHFKIRWKGYGPEEDTWEPIEGLSSCQEKLKEYVRKGYASNMLPLPGTVDVVCGGPPCQGISGFNRFREKEEPLKDPKNKQLVVFMDIVAHLKPKFVLMENVVDIVRFADGFLGRYALGRLVSMNYQARMGLMAAGAYGLPQFRMRMFMWGALSTEKLPQYPLPTHDVVIRGNVPLQFEANAVAFEAGSVVEVKPKLFLGDAISDLPPVANDESRDEIPYSSEAKTEFQQFIRLRRDEMPGSLCFNSGVVTHQLYDHRPLCLNQDDYERVCRIPKKKGANFRDLPGVRVRPDNKVEWDPDVERQKVSSGKPLVPDYAMTFVRGTSSKPFGRLWWDVTVPTVVTRAEPHNQVILHPEQDRVLSIRENARLQGFPDYYKLLGPIKERYIQVGNAVAVPVARALGYALAMALRGLSEKDPLLTLPRDFPMMRDAESPSVDV